LDFFAGSGVTTRIAIEEKRHSIAADNSPTLHGYLKQQLVDVDTLWQLAEGYSYEIMDKLDIHPIFGNGDLKNSETGKPSEKKSTPNLQCNLALDAQVAPGTRR
jgi:hypothetical protein